MKLIPFILSLLVFVLGSGSVGLAAGARCSSLFEELSLSGRGDTILYHRDGASYGFMGFRYNPSSKTLSVDYTKVDERYRGQGVATVLLQSLLDRYPQTEQIKTQFVSHNSKIYFDAKKAGATELEALSKTPAYKMRVRLGFSKIVSFDSVNEVLVVARSSDNR